METASDYVAEVRVRLKRPLNQVGLKRHIQNLVSRAFHGDTFISEVVVTDCSPKPAEVVEQDS